MRVLSTKVAAGVSLRTVIFLTCVALICACAGAVAIATYITNSDLILSIAKQSFERSGAETIDNTQYLLQPVSAAIEATAASIEDDAASVDGSSLPRSLAEIVALYPQVYSAYVSSESDGRFVQIQRIDYGATAWGPSDKPLPGGSRYVLRTVAGDGADRTDIFRYFATWGETLGSETLAHATYDPRVRPFYRAALEAPGRVLTDVYTFASNGKPGLTIARRLFKAGRTVGVVAADITLERLSQFLAAQPVGEHGTAVILDADGRLIAEARDGRSTPVDGAETVDGLGRPSLSEAWRLSRTSPATFTFSYGGIDHLAAVRHFPPSFGKSWVILETAPVDDFVGQLKATFRHVTAFSLLIAVLAGLGSLLVAGRITEPLNRLTLEADQIRSFVLDERVTGRSRIREIQHLIESMSAMKTALRTLASEDTDHAALVQLVEGLERKGPDDRLFRRVMDKVERRRARETELSLASAIQHSVLPSGDDMSHSALKIAARMRAAREIGGDFYDWMWRENGRVVFVIGDVSGKGIPAALFMASTRTAIRTMVMAGSSLATTAENTNRLLAENNDRCFFVTLFIGEFDPGSGELTYINAGHEPACIIGPDREIGELRAEGPALGVIDDAEFPVATAWLRPGDTLVALTDGVADAVDGAGGRFGEGRLRRTLIDGPTGDASGIVDGIFTAVDAFAMDELQFDDITCIVLHFAPGRAISSAAA